jgi:hypothetical protein
MEVDSALPRVLVIRGVICELRKFCPEDKLIPDCLETAVPRTEAKPTFRTAPVTFPARLLRELPRKGTEELGID